MANAIIPSDRKLLSLTVWPITNVSNIFLCAVVNSKQRRRVGRGCPRYRTRLEWCSNLRDSISRPFYMYL